MSKSVQIVARLDAEAVSIIDSMPGATRTEKLRNLIEQRGLVAAMLDEQKATLEQVQRAVMGLHQNLPKPTPQPAPQPGGLSSADLASLFHALGLLANGVSKPAMASEAASFCAAKMREIAAKNRS